MEDKAHRQFASKVRGRGGTGGGRGGSGSGSAVSGETAGLCCSFRWQGGLYDALFQATGPIAFHRARYSRAEDPKSALPFRSNKPGQAGARLLPLGDGGRTGGLCWPSPVPPPG